MAVPVLESRRSVWQQLASHGWRHWATVVVLTVAGFYAGHLLGKSDAFVTVRYRVYNATMGLTHGIRGPLYPQRTAIILIGDEEYWSDTLAARAPVNREYLARLVEKAAEAQPAAIAIDFDLRSPRPDGSVTDFHDYAGESQVLAATVARASEHTAIILPASVGWRDGEYFRQASVLDKALVAKPFVNWGYIELPFDLRRVPVVLDLAEDKTLDSFSGAAIRAADEEAYHRVENAEADSLPFASYITEQEFRDSKHVLSATALLDSDPATLRSLLSHRVVFIGANWSSDAFGTGRRVDMHNASTGLMPGVMLHANYVEAVLGQRTYRPISDSVIEGLEFLLVLIISVVAALELRTWIKWSTVAGIFCASLLLTYVLIQSLGMFFDFFVPLLVLGAHLGIDKVLEWRKKAVLVRGAAHS